MDTNTLNQNETASSVSNPPADVQSYLSPRAIARPKGVAGRGVFATQAIERNELVAMWGGRIYHEDQTEELSPDLKHYLLQIDEKLYIGPQDLDHIDDSELFNHSCNPNCGMRGQIALVAMRDIFPGEELTFDYAMAETYDQIFLCECGAHNCRKNILGTDHLLPALQENYQGYWSGWLKDKHKKIEKSEERLSGFELMGAWGLDTALDLRDCDPDIIRSAEKIKEFTIQLCDLIKVKRFGEPTIVHFGEDERVAGYSLVQLIETSLVSGHFANLTNRVYLDVFSCAYYDPEVVARFARNFFKAGSYSINSLLRR